MRRCHSTMALAADIHTVDHRPRDLRSGFRRAQDVNKLLLRLLTRMPRPNMLYL
jgi:hypothetical protein